MDSTNASINDAFLCNAEILNWKYRESDIQSKLKINGNAFKLLLNSFDSKPLNCTFKLNYLYCTSTIRFYFKLPDILQLLKTPLIFEQLVKDL